MPQNHVTIYTMVETGIDIDHGTFPNPQARGSYLSFERANEVLEQLAIEEKAKLNERCDQEDRGENYWRHMRMAMLPPFLPALIFFQLL